MQDALRIEEAVQPVRFSFDSDAKLTCDQVRQLILAEIDSFHASRDLA